jgi:hypothetical protein|eukprot:g527.t1
MVKVNSSAGPSSAPSTLQTSVGAPLPGGSNPKLTTGSNAKVLKSPDPAPLKHTAAITHLDKIIELGQFPKTQEFIRARRSAQRCTKYNVKRLNLLQEEVTQLKATIRTLKRPRTTEKDLAKIGLQNGKLAIRAIKREHFMFKSVAEITDEYFKSLLDQTPIGKPDWKLLRKKLIADRRNRVIVQKHTTLCTSTHATQNTMWDFERKDQMGILLMLAQRATGSQRGLKYFRTYMTESKFLLSDCWTLDAATIKKNRSLKKRRETIAMKKAAAGLLPPGHTPAPKSKSKRVPLPSRRPAAMTARGDKQTEVDPNVDHSELQPEDGEEDDEGQLLATI